MGGKADPHRGGHAKNLARELHDEIGQNITAIQIQSQLVKRARDPAQIRSAASQINARSPAAFISPPANCCASCGLRA
ncbi:histidine kinase [Escherichia coli]